MDNFEAVNCCCLVVEFDGELQRVYLCHFCPVADIQFVYLTIDTDKHFATIVDGNEVNIVGMYASFMQCISLQITVTLFVIRTALGLQALLVFNVTAMQC
jgi:hypothetical protein